MLLLSHSPWPISDFFANHLLDSSQDRWLVGEQRALCRTNVRFELVFDVAPLIFSASLPFLRFFLNYVVLAKFRRSRLQKLVAYIQLVVVGFCRRGSVRLCLVVSPYRCMSLAPWREREYLAFLPTSHKIANVVLLKYHTLSLLNHSAQDFTPYRIQAVVDP